MKSVTEIIVIVATIAGAIFTTVGYLYPKSEKAPLPSLTVSDLNGSAAYISRWHSSFPIRIKNNSIIPVNYKIVLKTDIGLVHADDSSGSNYTTKHESKRFSLDSGITYTHRFTIGGDPDYASKYFGAPEESFMSFERNHTNFLNISVVDLASRAVIYESFCKYKYREMPGEQAGFYLLKESFEEGNSEICDFGLVEHVE